MTSVSIITITRNDLAGLQATRRSVQEQSHPDIQHVIVDGASTDGTPELLASWQASMTSDTLRVVSELDDGIADAMNKGVRLAEGDLIMHLNAGDALVHEDVIAQVVDSYETHGWTWGVGNLLYRENGATYRRRIDGFSRRHLLRGCYLAQPATFFASAVTPCIVFDTSFRIAMDYDLFVRLAFTEGLEPEALRIDVTFFDRGGVSRDFWAAYRENVRVRKKYAPATWSPSSEFFELIRTLLKRGGRRVVLLLAGDRAKNRLREAVGDDVYGVELVR